MFGLTAGPSARILAAPILTAAAVTALLAAAVFPPAAAAVTTVTINNNVLRAVSGPGETNDITVDLDVTNGELVISDSGAGVATLLPCGPSGIGVACPLSSSRPPQVLVRTGDRRDRVQQQLAFALFSPILFFRAGSRIVFDGGPGDDSLYGGMAVDRLIGGQGNDRMFGFEGPDTLLGGPGKDILDRPGSAGPITLAGGRDTYLAGPGADRVRARDFTRDLRIDCGPGADRLARDAFDPAARSC
ncbi:MAG: hypothetical protein U0R52_03110 [Solirubrobacterales bacterium]